MKKGFTLIELLAVIVIVAIITLIATPIISNVVNNSKVGALKNSAYGLLEASNLYYAQNGSKGIRFDINENAVSSNDATKLLNYKGSIKRGTVIIDKKGNTTICITDGTNSAYKNYNDNDITTVTKETCNIPENKSIVYLENSGATRSELTNQELTDLVSTLQDEISNLKEQLNSKVNQSDFEIVNNISNSKATLNEVYPVGSVYITVTENTIAKVHEKLGGTWQQISNGRVLQGVNGSQSAGTTIEAGLPNIEGGFGIAYMTRGWAHTSGPFSTGSYGFKDAVTDPSSSGYDYSYYFNAHKANSIYGNSTTVQPPAYLVYMYKRVA